MAGRVTAIALLLTAIVAGTLMGVLAKWALLEIDPFTFVWLQLAFAVPTLTVYTFAFHREPWPRLPAKTLWQIVGIGLVNFALVRLCMMQSLEQLPATTFGYLQSFVGIVTMGLSVVWLRERPALVQVFGAVTAIAGIRIFFWEVPAATSWKGLVYAGLVVAGLAVSNNWTRALLLAEGAGLSSRMLTTLGLVAGGAPVILAGLALDWPPPVASPTHWAVIAGNGIVGIALVFAAFNRALRTLRSFEASILASSGILWTALFAFWILDERLAAHQAWGIGVMLVGQGLAQLRRGTGAS